MPVTGNEEHGVLSLQSTNVSAGIPLKKRRHLLVQLPSPPRQEVPPCVSEENDAEKIEKSGSDVNIKEGSSLDFNKKEESGSDLINKQEPVSDVLSNGESCLDANKNKDFGLGSKRQEGSKSDFDSGGKSGIAMKNQVESNSDQIHQNVNIADICVGTLDVGKNSTVVKKEIMSVPNANLENLKTDFSGSKCCEAPLANLASVSKMEGKAKPLLAEESRSPEVPATVSVKQSTHTKQLEEDCKLKLCSGSESAELALQPRELLGVGHQIAMNNSRMPDKFDNSLLSLSLRNVKNVAKENGDPRLGSVSDYACANRSYWDLNTTMDTWERSTGDAASKATIDMLSESSVVCVPSVSSTSDRNGIAKGKQVVEADEQRSDFPISSVQRSHPSEDSLRLTLRTCAGGSSVKVDSRIGASILNPQNTSVPTITAKYPRSGVVKSEPIDENCKNASAGVTGSPIDLLDCGSVKSEPVLSPDIEAVKLSINSSHTVIAQEPIKLELHPEIASELSNNGERTLEPSFAKAVHCPESASSSSSVLPMPLTPEKLLPSRLVISSEQSVSIDVSNHSEHSVHTEEGHKGNDALDRIAADMVSKPVHKGREGKVSGHKLDTSKTLGNNVDSEMSGSKMMNEAFNELREGCASDEEKIDVSAEMMEDESYGSECESDGDQAFSSCLDGQDRCARGDDDYEDGEVREGPVHSTVEGPSAEGMDTECVNHLDPDIKCNPAFAFSGERNLQQFHLADKDNKLEVHDDKVADGKECVGTASIETNKQLQLATKDGTKQILVSDEITTAGDDEKSLASPTQKASPVQCGKTSVLEGDEKDILCETTRPGHNTMTTIEPSLDGNDVAEYSVSGGNRSRIINLPRASVTSPRRTTSISDRPFSSRSGREKYSDLDGKRFHLRGNRDEIDPDGPRRFVRERIHDHSFRNSRLNYVRGRGRFSGRLDTSRSEWNPEHEFFADNYTGGYRFVRNKRSSAMNDAELESNSYITGPDGAALNSSGGRKPFNNDLPSFRHPRRLSPAGRDGLTTRDLQIHRMIPSNISPSRRNDENGVDLVGLQRDDKFVRVFPDDIVNPGYNRPQPLYEGGDGQFVRGNRNFSAMQRRGFPRMRSKSPAERRMRSPGPRMSPRRRSPDVFSGISQLTQHRSGNLYGVGMMRSPDRSCFSEEMIARRRGSPSYIARDSNDTRVADSLREHGHPRAINSNRRSPSDRVFNRSTRRLDVLDPRIRAGEDEFFGRPAHSNRFHEFHGDGNSDERRKSGDRHGLLRPFRPPYAIDGDNLRFHLDDGQRPFRFCSEGNTEFVGRSMREREFEGRIKTRSVVGTRRIRSIDEQEGNFRHNCQVWHDGGLNEAFGFKKRRF